MSDAAEALGAAALSSGVIFEWLSFPRHFRVNQKLRATFSRALCVGLSHTLNLAVRRFQMCISRYSLLRAKARLEASKRNREVSSAPAPPDTPSDGDDAPFPADYVSTEARAHADLANALKTFNATSSQIGDARPLSGCALSPCATIA